MRIDTAMIGDSKVFQKHFLNALCPKLLNGSLNDTSDTLGIEAKELCLMVDEIMKDAMATCKVDPTD